MIELDSFSLVLRKLFEDIDIPYPIEDIHDYSNQRMYFVEIIQAGVSLGCIYTPHDSFSTYLICEKITKADIIVKSFNKSLAYLSQVNKEFNNVICRYKKEYCLHEYIPYFVEYMSLNNKKYNKGKCNLSNFKNLKKLRLNISVPLSVMIPNNLEYLKFGDNFDGDFILPEKNSLKVLIFGKKHKLPLNGKLRNTKLKVLYLGYSFNSSLVNELPETLEYLDINRCFKQDLTDILPPNLKYLSFNGGRYNHHLTKIPNLNQIYINCEGIAITFDESFTGKIIFNEN